MTPFPHSSTALDETRGSERAPNANTHLVFTDIALMTVRPLARVALQVQAIPGKLKSLKLCRRDLSMTFV